jgi:tetratricopeptide (TPR) repeat protein
MADTPVTEADGADLVAIMQSIGAGQYAEAEKLCESILESRPNDAGVLHAMGLTHYMGRRYTRAIEYMLKAVQFDDTNPQYYLNLGESMRRAQRPDDAIGMFEKALALKPEYQLAHLGVANTLRDQGHRPEAIARYRLALALDPTFAEAFHYLGVMFLEQERHTEAIAYLRKAVSLKPTYLEARLALAGALDKDGQIDEAIEVYSDIIETDQSVTAAHNNLANILKSKGNIEGAIGHYEQALEINPNNVQARYNLSRARKADADDSEIPVMEEMLQREGLQAPDRVNLHFTLGKIYDGLERYDEAFEHFRQGNELDDRAIPFDPEGHGRHIDRLISIFNPQLFARRQGYGSDSERPIFIVGIPRSGTTLTEQVLASHPMVYGAGELDRVSQLINAASVEISGAAAYPECAFELDAMTACRLGESYISYIRRLSGNSPHVTDKMPGNFIHLGFIAMLLPGAKIIHCRRQPMDSCFSCYTQHFTSPMPFATKLENLGHYYQGYERIMTHWHEVLPLEILDVAYEDMVESHEEKTREILDFCGLEWDEACLQFHLTERTVKTASTWQVRQPLYSSSVSRWRRYEGHLAPLKEALGDAFYEA